VVTCLTSGVGKGLEVWRYKNTGPSAPPV
jgi:hypothetical protein